MFERRFLEDWPPDPADWGQAKVKERGFVTAAHLEPMALYYMDAKRDIEDDFRRTGSFWRRLTSDLGLPAKDIEAFEEEIRRYVANAGRMRGDKGIQGAALCLWLVAKLSVGLGLKAQRS